MRSAEPMSAKSGRSLAVSGAGVPFEKRTVSTAMAWGAGVGVGGSMAGSGGFGAAVGVGCGAGLRAGADARFGGVAEEVGALGPSFSGAATPAAESTHVFIAATCAENELSVRAFSAAATAALAESVVRGSGGM